MRHAHPLFPLLVGLMASSTALADEPPNLFGGRVGPSYGYVSVGFPDLEGGVRFGLGKVELGVRLRTTLGVVPYAPVPNTVAFLPGLDMRWMLLESGDVTGSLVASVHVGVAVPNGVDVGVGLLHPGFVVTWRLADIVDLDFGLQVQDDLWFIDRDGAYLTIAVPVIFGAEYGVTDDVTVGVRFEGGPSFNVGVTNGQGVGGVGPRFRGVFGAAFAF